MSTRYVLSAQLLTLVLSISQLLHLDIDELLSYYRTWGPSARTCINLVRGDLKVDEHMRSVSIAAAEFAADPHRLFRLVAQFDSDDVSHLLFAVRPEEHSRGMVKAQVPTKHLNGIIALAVARFDAAQQSLFFTRISSHPWTKEPASWMFEKFVHIQLVSTFSTQFTCVPADNTTETLTIPVCTVTHPLNGTTGLSEANKYTLPFYWRPTSTSFTSINGIICTDSDMVLIQATVSSRHDVKVAGLGAIRDGLPVKFRRERNWRLILITPSEESARALCNWSTILPEGWEELDIYSYTFMNGQHTLNDAEQEILAKYIVSYVPFQFLSLIRTLGRFAQAEDGSEAEADGDDEHKANDSEENDVIIFREL